MKKAWVCWLVTGVLLAGCGGSGGGANQNPEEHGPDDSEVTTIPADSQLLGTWKAEQFIGVYYTFTETAMGFVILDEVYGCVLSSGEAPISRFTEDRLILAEGTDAERVWLYDFDGDTLYLGISGAAEYTYDFERAVEDINTYSDCADASVTGSVSADLVFVELPEAIKIDHTITPLGRVEYFIDVNFDINNSGEIDDGDIFFSSRHFKPNGLAEPSQIALEDIGANIWGYQGNWSTDLVPAEIEITDNHLRMSVEKSEHPALSLISNSTQVNIAVSYTDLFGSTNDDYYPASRTYTEGLDTSLLEDVTGDVTDDNSGKFDLYQISISVEN